MIRNFPLSLECLKASMGYLYNVTPHVTKSESGCRSNLDRRTTRQPGNAVSLSRRWLIEQGLGWLKQTGPLRQVKLQGLEKVDWL